MSSRLSCRLHHRRPAQGGSMPVANPRKVFVTIPVKVLDTTADFFTRLVFEFIPQFTDENATCMVLGDEAFVMFLVEDFFKTFTKKDLPDTTTQVGSILALSAPSRTAVDDLVNEALLAGGQPANDPMDHGFMYAW